MDTIAVVNVLESVAATIASAFIIFLAASFRKYFRKHSTEHEFLMRQTRDNTDAIKRLLDLQERRETRATRRQNPR